MLKYFDEEKIAKLAPDSLHLFQEYDQEWQSYEGRSDVKFVSKWELDVDNIDEVILECTKELVPTFSLQVKTSEVSTYEKPKKATLEEAGVPTENMLHGVLMSIESNGFTEERMLKAFDDWQKYYSEPAATDFYCVVCHLICKADSDNLFRLSKAFPEHVKIFVENQLLRDVPVEKLKEVENEKE